MRIAGAILLLSALFVPKPAKAASQHPTSGVAVAQIQRSAPPQATKSESVPPNIESGATSTAGPSERDIQALHELEANYLRAEMENNPTLAESILADDYIGVKGDGSTANKLEVLRNLSKNERSQEPYNIVATGMRTQIFGDTACVLYTKVYTLPNRHTSYSENLLHIFTKRNGSWHLQVSSPIPASRPQPAVKP